MGYYKLNRKTSLVRIAIIGTMLAMLEIAAAAWISKALRYRISTSPANNIWAIIITIGLAIFWGGVMVIKAGSHPASANYPAFQREHLISWILSIVLFLIAEVYLIQTHGSVNVFFG